MRTNVELDEALLEAAFRYAPVRTKKDLIHLALRELRGKGGIAADYDHRRARERECAD